MYFAEKGGILDKRAYAKLDDHPYRPLVLTRAFGSWSRISRMVKREFPELLETVKDGVIEEVKETAVKKVFVPKKGAKDDKAKK